MPPGLITAQDLEEALVRRTFWFLAACSILILIPVKLAWWLMGGQVVGLLGLLELATVLWCAWRVWTSRSGASRYLGVGLAIVYLQVAAAAWMQGGLQAPALRWLAVLPIIAIVAGHLRLGLGFCAAFVAQILVMSFYEPPYLAALRPMVLPDAHAQSLVATIGSVVLFSVFGWIAVRWRAQVHQVLEVSHQQAQRGNEAKQRFLAIMSHEIRTPLNGIVGTASLLRQKDMPPQERRQMLHLLDHSSQTLLSLLNDVLDWAKLEAGQLEVREEVVRLRDLLADSADLFAVTAFDKGLELTCSFEPDVPRCLLGDEMRMRQALNNLVSNAVKFTRQGGVHVHLACEPPVGSARPGERVWVRIEVQDSGIGMNPGQVSNLFQPFSQADQSTTRQYGGTGLGLSISRELARCMGGDIMVSSRVGVGSCFVIRVPMARLPGAEAEPGQPVFSGQRLRLVTGRGGLRRQVQSLASDLGLVLAPEDAADADVDAVLVDAAVCTGHDRTWSWGAPGQPKALVSSAADAMPAPHELPARVLNLYKPLRAQALGDWLNGVLPDSVALAEPACAPSIPSGAALQVLVAEDSELNRALLGEMLSHCQAASCMVETGLAAVNAVKARRFDLLLMDYQMPEMDGLAATRVIRQREAEQGGPRLPIVLISGEINVECHAVWRAAGVDHILCKPFAFDKLARLVADIQQARQPQASAQAQ
ncbi:MAG: response regulator [Rubrivivax sp.]|nr:MAG: response regulator [Rubrivivax sp.]